MRLRDRLGVGSWRLAAAVGALTLLTEATPADAEQASASPPPASAPSARPALPPGHPRVSPEPEAQAPEPASSREMPPGVFQPPPDTTEDDPSLPGGTLVVDVLDADNHPVANAPLVLVVLHQSVAKGQTKENRPVKAGPTGQLRLDHLEIGSDVSYWVKHLSGPATFASSPVQMNATRGIHSTMHVYAVTTSLETALVVTQGAVYLEVKDDRVQVEQAVTFFNFGKTAWAPSDLVLRLPQGFTALTSQAQMSDQGIDPVEHVGARVRGTFAPGRHDLEFRWQLPYDGDREVMIDLAAPPHAAIMRVMAAAGHETTLEVLDFPQAEKRADRQGQRILVTEKQLRRDRDSAAISNIHIAIRGLSTPGPGRVVASILAAFGVLLGLFWGVRERTAPDDEASERAELLAEIEELERAHRRGDVGPRTYERVRRELIDALALTLDPA